MGGDDIGTGFPLEDGEAIFQRSDADHAAGRFDKFTRGFDFRSHGAGIELDASQFIRAGDPQRVLGRLAPIQVDGIGVGQDQQGIGLDLSGQVGGGHVFVDHRFDAGQALAIPGHRNAATTGTDDEVPLGDQGFDGVAFDDALGQRGRHHAAEELAVSLDDPMLLFGQDAISIFT